METKRTNYLNRYGDEIVSDTTREIWKRRQILSLAFLCRIMLIFYGRIHDYLFDVQFTDIDYKVYSEAAQHIFHGRSPYERATYRYTPFLAWLLMPVVKWPDFGKFLFCTVDMAVGFLYFELANSIKTGNRWSGSYKDNNKLRLKKSVVIFWLANPLTAVISSRGNADVLVCAAVLWTLYLLLRDQWCSAALVHGLFAVHMKLYPIIYLPSIFLSLSTVSVSSGWIDYCRRMIVNMKGYIFVLTSCSCFLLSVAVCFMLYGREYLDEAVLYHLHRTDTRHNFSPYFYLLYLAADNVQLCRLIGFCAFVPQASLIVWLAFRFHNDLPFCWLLTTIAFVSFNKVCTSQYFIWYICLLPIAQQSIEMPPMTAVYLISVWLIGQALWLYPAYLFEFKGYDTFCLIWLASLFFLAVNTGIIVQLIRYHTAGTILAIKNARKIYLHLLVTAFMPSAVILHTLSSVQLKYDPLGNVEITVLMLYLIGLGLGDVDDITVKGLNIVKKCSRIFLESYTSILSFGLEKRHLEEFYGKQIVEADRTLVEQRSDEILDEAVDSDICLLVVGDPFGATTHADLVLRARERDIPVRIVHNASIVNAVGCCGLQLYKFGEIVSIVLWEENWQPDSYYDKIVENRKRGLHTLCLLDIKAKEQSVEDMMRGRNRYLPPRYMSCAEAAKQLLEIAERKQESGIEPVYTSTTQCVGLARIGWDNQKIVFCSLEAMCQMDMGPPLHSLIIPGELHPMELGFLKHCSS